MFETREAGTPLGLYRAPAVCAGEFQVPSDASICCLHLRELQSVVSAHDTGRADCAP